jgi:hypothetical protein
MVGQCAFIDVSAYLASPFEAELAGTTIERAGCVDAKCIGTALGRAQVNVVARLPVASKAFIAGAGVGSSRVCAGGIWAARIGLTLAFVDLSADFTRTPVDRIIPISIIALAVVTTLQIGALAKFAALVEAIVAALINILAAITLIEAMGAILAYVGSQRVNTGATFVTGLKEYTWTGVQVTLINVRAVRPIPKHAGLAGARE